MSMSATTVLLKSTRRLQSTPEGSRFAFADVKQQLRQTLQNIIQCLFWSQHDQDAQLASPYDCNMGMEKLNEIYFFDKRDYVREAAFSSAKEDSSPQKNYLFI